MAKGGKGGKGKKKQQNSNNKYNNKNGGQSGTGSDQAGGKKAIETKRQVKTSTSSNDGMTDLFKDDRVITSHQAKLNDNWAANNSVNIVTAGIVNRRPRGLNNLGNTCYFNSVLQVLSKTPGLRSALDSRSAKDIPWTSSYGDSIRGEIEEYFPLETILPSPGEVMIALIVALRSMDNPNHKGPFSPGGLLNEISRKNNQFKGRQQQDSHELLRTLLDLIKTGESNRQKEAVLTALQIEDVKNIDDDTKAVLKNYSPSCNFTLVDSLFGGYTLSSIRCSECDTISQIMEPFFDLSVPINDSTKKPWVSELNFKGKKGNQKNCGTSSSVPIALPPPPPPLPPLIFEPINKDTTISEQVIDEKKQKSKELEKNTHVTERKQKRQEKKANKRAVKEAAKVQLKKKVVTSEFVEISNDVVAEPLENWDDENKADSLEKDRNSNECKSTAEANCENFVDENEKDTYGEKLESGDKLKAITQIEEDELSDLDVGIVPLLDEVEEVSKIEVNPPSNENPVNNNSSTESDQNKAAIITYQVTEDPKSFEITVGIETEKTVHLQFDHKSSKGINSVEYDSTQPEPLINLGVLSPELIKKKESLDSDVGTSGTPPDEDNQELEKQRLLDSEDEGISEGDGDSSTKAVIDDDEQLEQVSVNLDDFNDIDDNDSDDNVFGGMSNLFGETDPSCFEPEEPDHEGFDPTSQFEPPDFDEFQADILVQDFSVFDLNSSDTGLPGGVDFVVDEEMNNLKLDDLSDPVDVSLDMTADIASEDDKLEEAGDSSATHEQSKPFVEEPIDPLMKSKVEWSMKTIKSLKPVSNDSEPSLESCLSMFSRPEVLTGGNKLFCETCTKRAASSNPRPVKGQSKPAKVFSDASKSMIIAYPPPILTLHLKRFTAEGFSLRKISRNVTFPFELDLSSWTSNIYPTIAQSLGVNYTSSIRYKLFGLVEHSGTLKFGHYTATIKVSTSKSREENLKKFSRLKPFVSSVENFLKKVPENVLDPESACLPENDEEDEKENKKQIEEEDLEDKWYYISDSHVSEIKQSDVLSTEAYLLFYERI